MPTVKVKRMGVFSLIDKVNPHGVTGGGAQRRAGDLAGDFDSALEWLNDAKSWGFLNAKFLETTDVSMVAFRRDQRFIALLDDMRDRQQEVIGSDDA